MRFPSIARPTFVCALGFRLGPHCACLGEDCNDNGRADIEDIAPIHIAFGAIHELEVTGHGETPWGSTVADFNADGSLDVVVTSSAGRVYLIRNHAGGAFDEPAILVQAAFPGGITAIDVDQDGATDVVYRDEGELRL